MLQAQEKPLKRGAQTCLRVVLSDAVLSVVGHVAFVASGGYIVKPARSKIVRVGRLNFHTPTGLSINVVKACRNLRLVYPRRQHARRNTQASC